MVGYTNVGITFFRFVTIHAFNRRTDRRTAFSWLDFVACNHSAVKMPQYAKMHKSQAFVGQRTQNFKEMWAVLWFSCIFGRFLRLRL